MPSYYSGKHHRPRRHGLSAVGMVVHRGKVREPYMPPPSREPPTDAPKEPLKDESMGRTASPPTPEWSKWESIKYPNWDGYWRAKIGGNGGWTYEFTQDFTTIWEQKAAEVASPAQPPRLSAAPTTTASEPMLLGEAMALAAVSRAPPRSQPIEASSSIPAANSGCDCASCQDDYLQAEPFGASALTRTDKKDGKGEPTVIAGPSDVTSNQEGVPCAVVRTTRKGDHSQHCRTHKKAHRRSHHSKRAARHPKKIGEVVRADKEKKYDPRAIVDNWDWEWE